MIAGSIVALVTPMTVDQAVDRHALERLVDWHIQEGTDAIVAVGTTGESATLSVAEHCDVISIIVASVAGKIPVIAGTGANATMEAVELTKAAKGAGADACLLVTPYYNKPTQEGLYRHHEYVAAAVDIPQILYNVPGRTGVDMLPETISRLADLPNIIGIKEATGDLERGYEIISQCASRIDVYSGDDCTAGELMLMGAKGNISVTANIVPKAMRELCAEALTGNADRSRAMNNKLAPLHDALFIESNPIPVKWALQKMGRIASGIRLPLTPLAESCQPDITAAMKTAGIL
jgi:4-hydroxy-tetrahydrodipicolinate synthase